MGNPFDEAFGSVGSSWDDHDALSLALEPGEKVVWSGRPTTWAMVRRSLGLALIGLIYGAFALYLFVTITQGEGLRVGRGRQLAKPFERVAFACVTLAMTAVGAFMLVGPLRAIWRANRTSYALTNRRVLVFEPRLLGGRRERAFTPEVLDLMRCKERGDGSGDLIFDVRKDLSGWSQPVGFVGVDRVREIESLVRRNLRADDRKSADRLESATGIWRLRIITRYYVGLFFSFLLLLAASWLVVGPVLLAMLAYGLVAGHIPLDRIDFVAVAAIVVVGVPLCGLAIVGLIALHKHWFVQPFEIAINDDRTVTFRNWFRTRVVPVTDILSVRSGGWMDPNSNGAVVRHKQGAVSMINDFPNFRDFASKLKALNPSIEIHLF